IICDFLSFFFFQAEDGIRDATVTGVQTCALPIYHFPRIALSLLGGSGQPSLGGRRFVPELGKVHRTESVMVVPQRFSQMSIMERSEERRVGKEWRCGWERSH